MITFLLCLIIIILLTNTIITHIEIKRMLKLLNDENPDEFKEKFQEFKKEYRTFIKRWGKF